MHAISGMKKTFTTARLFHKALSLDNVTLQAPILCSRDVICPSVYLKPEDSAYQETRQLSVRIERSKALIRCMQISGMKKTCTTARLFHEALSLDNDTSQAPDCVCEMAMVLMYT